MPVWHDPCIDTSYQLTTDAVDTYLDTDGVSIYPNPTYIATGGINFAALDITTAAINATGDFTFRADITVPDLILPEDDGGLHVFYLDLEINQSPYYFEIYYRQGQIASNLWEQPNIELTIGSTAVYTETLTLPRSFVWQITRVGTTLTMHMDNSLVYTGSTNNFIITGIDSHWDANSCDTYDYDWYAPKINDLILVWGAGQGGARANQLLNTRGKAIYFQRATAT